jgi:RecB family exonuclease
VTDTRIFSTAAQLQEFILQEGPGALTVVPHQRLARQLWHRQRLAENRQGHEAWEPLPLVTLTAWWGDLFRSLWAEVAPAPPLVRLRLWRQALVAAPPLEGVAPDLNWAQALDEMHELLTRHQLPVLEPLPHEPPLVVWRRRVTRIYTQLLREEGWITPGEVPGFLLKALEGGQIRLAQTVLVAGLETPAPVEEAWLRAAAVRTRLLRLHVRGDPQAVQAAVPLPDPDQEMAWVATQLAACHREAGLPLHRLAVTSPIMDHYAPAFARVLRELWGGPGTEAGWAYNFSLGPTLADNPLFQAAGLAPKFFAAGERRTDLVSLLLSPYLGALTPHGRLLPGLDRLFRENRLEQGWLHFRAIISREAGLAPVLARLDRAFALWTAPRLSVGEYLRRLTETWEALGFPGELQDQETVAWVQTRSLLQELAAALSSETLDLPEFLDWLGLAARRRLLPGPGQEEAGVQVLGLLEMRGLDFDRVYSLGMNAGAFPPPPRTLPLLSPLEKSRVLGATYESQRDFSLDLYGNLLGAAPHLTLTRPRVVDQEEQVATPLYLGPWQDPQEMVVLHRPHPAWVRAPSIRAAFAAPGEDGQAGPEEPLIQVSLPRQLAITRLRTALECPCRFLLEIIMQIRDLPEIEAGLSPMERGNLLHQLLARFAREYQAVLDDLGDWDEHRARDTLRRVAQELLSERLSDLHWQAEWDRWLGDGEEVPGLLWEWLRRERDRYLQGWRWVGIEVPFEGLKRATWPFALRGRLDRLDYHPADADLVIWDYKSGEIPKPKQVFETGEECQLPGYLLAVKEGLVPVPAVIIGLRAGFIGLKSIREDHLKHQDFQAMGDHWEQVTRLWEERVAIFCRRVDQGDFYPAPYPPPSGNNAGACKFCPYGLLCAFVPPDAPEPEGEGE